MKTAELIILAVLIAAAGAAVLFWKRWSGPGSAASQTIRGEVVAKSDASMPALKGYAGGSRVHDTYSVTFRTKEWERPFSVSVWLYDACEVGQTGTLTVKGGELMDFEPDGAPPLPPEDA